MEETNLTSQTKSLNPNRLLIAYVKLNSLKNKFEMLRIQTIIIGKVDILLITETKLDNSFPSYQVSLDGFSSLYRFHRKKNDGGSHFERYTF